MVVGFSSAYTSPALVSMTDNQTTPFEVTEQAVSEINFVVEISHAFDRESERVIECIKNCESSTTRKEKKNRLMISSSINLNT